VDNLTPILVLACTGLFCVMMMVALFGLLVLALSRTRDSKNVDRWAVPEQRRGRVNPQAPTVMHNGPAPVRAPPPRPAPAPVVSAPVVPVLPEPPVRAATPRPLGPVARPLPMTPASASTPIYAPEVPPIDGPPPPPMLLGDEPEVPTTEDRTVDDRTRADAARKPAGGLNGAPPDPMDAPRVGGQTIIAFDDDEEDW
jgi:hypothetical protein